MNSASHRFRLRTTCRACGGDRIECVLRLKSLPLLSPNVGADDVNAIEIAVPADLNLCNTCGLLQLMAVVDPAFQYNQFKYVTSISLGLPEHFRQSAGEILIDADLGSPGQLLEIGSNDGTLLRAFQEHGWRVHGIDPARKAAALATERGISTTLGFFNPATAHAIRDRFGPIDLVIANNTLANIDDLDSFAEGLDMILAPDGVFVFETSYGADVVQRMLLDTIYHEHLSYFTVKPLASYFSRHGMMLFDVRRIATKGGSIRGFVQRRGGTRPLRGSVADLIANEQASGLYGRVAYEQMSAGLNTIRDDLGRCLDRADARDKSVAGWGASVGCVSLINQLDLTGRLACVFDDHPLLDVIGGPGYRIPVVSPAELADRDPGLIILLAWRYAGIITANLHDYQKHGGRLVLPLPEVVEL